MSRSGVARRSTPPLAVALAATLFSIPCHGAAQATPSAPAAGATDPASTIGATALPAGEALPHAGHAADTVPLPAHRRVLSVNPVAFVAFGFLSVDYEQVLTRNTSLSGSGTYFRRGEVHYFTVDTRARYYLRDAALDGWSVGVLLGVVSRRDRVEDISTTGMGLGFLVEHQWLLGDDERLAITAGGGGQRLVYFSERPGRSVLPIIRLSLGWAF